MGREELILAVGVAVDDGAIAGSLELGDEDQQREPTLSGERNDASAGLHRSDSRHSQWRQRPVVKP